MKPEMSNSLGPAMDSWAYAVACERAENQRPLELAPYFHLRLGSLNVADGDRNG